MAPLQYIYSTMPTFFLMLYILSLVSEDTVELELALQIKNE